jgi:hypothetical protein
VLRIKTKGDDTKMVLSKKKIQSLVRGSRVGAFGAFKSKANATAYARALHDKGFKIQGFRSNGPVVDARGRYKAYSVLATGKSKKRAMNR